MIRITRFLYIHILLVPMLILAYALNSQMTFFMSFGIVLIHELFHLFASIILGVEVKSIVILPFGMTLRLEKNIIRYPKKEIIIALSGPLANVIMIILANTFYKENYNNLNFLLFMLINYSVLLINLIPVPPLDGGRILRAVMIRSRGLMGASKFLLKVSRFFVVLVFIMGILVLIKTRGNPSLCIIGAFLVFSMVEEKKTSDLLIMSELIYEKEKFKNRALIPTTFLTINHNAPAKKIIKKLNLSTFYIVYIVDDSLRIIKTATESDFVRAVRDKGYSVLAKEV